MRHTESDNEARNEARAANDDQKGRFKSRTESRGTDGINKENKETSEGEKPTKKKRKHFDLLVIFFYKTNLETKFPTTTKKE